MTEATEMNITNTICKQVVQESMDHLFSIIRNDGRFIYAHILGNPKKILPGYNLLRHCGTAWFMLKAANRLNLELRDEDLSRLVSAVSFIIDLLRRPAWSAGLVPTLCLPEGEKVKMGGAGLCLLMLNEFKLFSDRHGIDFKSNNDGLPAKIITTRLKNHMLSEIVDGDFHHIRSYSTGRLLPFTSDYYTGQALFGLIQADEARDACGKLLSQLIDRSVGISEHAHWMAYAAAEAIRMGLPGTERTLQYLDQLIGRMVAESEYRDRRQSTPIACHSEAFLVFLEARNRAGAPTCDVDEDLPASVQKALFDNLELQFSWYRNGQFAEGDGSNKVQIDMIQHNAASFLGVLLLEFPR